MRTTLTLDDDLAIRIEHLRAEAGITWKDAVNQLLRAGLDRTEAAPAPRAPYRLTPVSTGSPRVDLTRTSEIAILEDERDWSAR